MARSNPGIDRGDTFGQIIPPGTVPKITTIFDVSAEFLGELRLWLEQNPPTIAISNVIGFNQFTVQASNFIPTSETTASTSYTNLGTVGPTISSLPGGKYLIIVTAVAAVIGTNGDGSYMAPSVNGAVPSDNDAAQNKSLSLVGTDGYSLQTLPTGSNTIVAQYRVSTSTGSTASFSQRKMFAIRFANQ